MPVGDLEEEGGPGKAEDEEVAPSQYGNNTPIDKSDGKRQRRLSLAPAGVWVQVKRLKDPHMRKSILASKVSTHVCILCWARLTLTIDKRRGCYLTTNALKHMREVHKEDAKASQERGDAKEVLTGSRATQRKSCDGRRRVAHFSGNLQGQRAVLRTHE